MSPIGKAVMSSGSGASKRLAGSSNIKSVMASGRSRAQHPDGLSRDWWDDISDSAWAQTMEKNRGTTHPDGLSPAMLPAVRANTAVPKTGAPVSSGGAGGAGMGTMMGVGMGAAAGATTSWMTGGSIGQGAVMGGIGGGAMGLGGGAMMARGGRRANIAAGNAGLGFSSSLARTMKGMENPASRAYMFGAGGMLGGMMFGGNKSHKRGFNSKRGNSIGR